MTKKLELYTTDDELHQITKLANSNRGKYAKLPRETLLHLLQDHCRMVVLIGIENVVVKP